MDSETLSSETNSSENLQSQANDFSNENIENCTNEDPNCDFELIKEDNNEFYCIDINENRKYVICGGKNEYAEVFDFREDQIVAKIENFEESVLFTKFLKGDRFLIVTVDGTIALMEYDKEICIINIEEDITSVGFNEYLVVGTGSGRVYMYDSELEHINTFGSHSKEILAVEYSEGRILSMCQNTLVVHDKCGRKLYTLKATEATAFKYISSDVICFARDNKIQVFKENKKLFDYSSEGSVEAVEYLNNTLIIGGDFEHLLLIDTAGHYATFKLQIKQAVLNVKKIEEYKVAFSTMEGLIGVVDIRSLNTLKYYNANVGLIFDFATSPGNIAVAGECGYNVIDLLHSESYTLQELESLMAKE